jgi:hypothetical protein
MYPKTIHAVFLIVPSPPTQQNANPSYSRRKADLQVTLHFFYRKLTNKDYLTT